MHIKKLAATTAVLAAISMTAACGSDTEDSSATSSEPTGSSPMSDEPIAEDAAADPAANLVGSGCAGYAEAVPDGKGSVEGMAKDPVAVAAGNNPILTTLTAAVSGQLNPKVDLVDTLNGDEFTVFAPVDDAFAKLPKATVNTLKKDDALLSSILTYHVVPGQMTPDQIAGKQATVQGGKITVKGSGDNLTVNGAKVICGGVQTANATVYLIDTVLSPEM